MSEPRIVALAGIGEVRADDSVARLIAAAAADSGLTLDSGVVLCVSQKVVSKAEGRVRSLTAVEPGPRARELAAALDKDPAVVELVLGESKRIVRAIGGVLITETHSGLVCANAGIDASNVPGADAVALLPADPDASARRIRSELAGVLGVRPAILITDSFGRPWRIGQAETAIGCAGIQPIEDLRGELDRDGRELSATVIAVADQLAAAADLGRSKRSGTPVVAVLGAERWITEADGPGAAALRRPEAEDLFR